MWASSLYKIRLFLYFESKLLAMEVRRFHIHILLRKSSTLLEEVLVASQTSVVEGSREKRNIISNQFVYGVQSVLLEKLQ